MSNGRSLDRCDIKMRSCAAGIWGLGMAFELCNFAPGMEHEPDLCGAIEGDGQGPLSRDSSTSFWRVECSA